MPKPDLRRARGQETRRALIDAAIASVARHGLSGTTLNTVAAQAGAARASVGFHFRSKDQLLAAALSHALSLYEASLGVAVAAAPTAREKLLATLRHDIIFPTEHPAMLALWFAAWGQAQALAIYRAETLPYDRTYRAEIRAQAFAACQDAALADQYSNIIPSFTFGVWLEYHIDPENYDIDAKLAAAARLLAMLGPGAGA